MRLILPLALLGVAFTTGTFKGSVDYISIQWCVLFWFTSALIGWTIAKKTHWSVGLLVCYLLANGLFTYYYQGNFYAHNLDNVKVVLGYWSILGAVNLLFLIALQCLSIRFLQEIKVAFAAMCLINSAWVVFIYEGGLFGSTSINSTSIAFMYPVLLSFIFKLRWKRWPGEKIIAISLPLLAIYKVQSSIAIGTLIVGVSVLLWMKIRSKELKAILIFGTITVGLSVGYSISPDKMFHDNRRFQMYEYAMGDWWKMANHWVGTGYNTWTGFAPIVQRSHGYLPNNLFTWMHSDWLQILFETGFIGLILTLNVFFWAALNAIKRQEVYLLAALLSYASSMIFNYPLRLGLHAFFLVFLITSLHQRDETY